MPNVFDFNPTSINPFPYWKWNKVLPAVYDDSLSQYELMAKIVSVVNNIIMSTNSTGEQVEQLTQLVQQLIDGGFPSGIVQYVTDIVNSVMNDEIVDIYTNINSRVAAFKDINELTSTSLIEGSIAHTNGFNSQKDGGASWYEITSTGTANGMDIIQCDNNLNAILQNSESFINVAQYGVDLTGTNDASAIIQYVIDSFPKNTIYFPNGRYKIDTIIRTWPDNEKYVNLIFAPNAEFFTNNQLDCLFNLGGYDMGSNYGTIETLGYKKFFVGGRFNGTNCNFAVKAASSVCDQQFIGCTFFNCNSGLQIGHVTSDRSVDSYIAYCNFIGTGAAESYGIQYMKPDNSINHCRIYGFKTCIYQKVGGLYAFDIHTLDLSQAPRGYDCDDSCVVDLPDGGRNTLIAVYGNGEGTFLRLNGEYVNLLKVVDCEYRNWTLSASNFVFIDILNDNYTRVHATITGNTVIADNPYSSNKVRYGIRGLSYSTDIAIADNVLWGTEHLTSKADPICLVNNIPFLTRIVHVMKVNHWYYVGSLKMAPYMNEYNIQFNIGLNKIGFALLLRNTSSPVVTYAKYAITPYVPNPGVYHVGYVRNGDVLDFYVYSETATPAFSIITGFVEETGKQYYLANIYKDRGDDTGYSQADRGGAVGTFNVDGDYSFNMAMNSNGSVIS